MILSFTVSGLKYKREFTKIDEKYAHNNRKITSPILELSFDNLKEKMISKLKESLNSLQIEELLYHIKNYLYNEENRNLLLQLRYLNLYERNFDMLKLFRDSVNKKDKLLNKISNFDNDILILLLKLGIYDYILPNLKFQNKKEVGGTEKFLLNYEYDLFDSLQIKTLKILEDILEVSQNTKINKIKNKDYINADLWKIYAQENINIFTSGFVEFKTNINKDYIHSIETHEIIKNEEIYEETIYNYVAEVYSEEELLYAFLSILFIREPHFVIRRCKTCNNFFVARKSDIVECNRPVENGLTHKEKIKKNKDKYKNLTIIRKMEMDITKRMSAKKDAGKDDEYEKFLKEKAKAKKDGYIFEYLNSFYKEPAQKRHIKELEKELEENKKNID